MEESSTTSTKKNQGKRLPPSKEASNYVMSKIEQINPSIQVLQDWRVCALSSSRKSSRYRLTVQYTFYSVHYKMLSVQC